MNNDPTENNERKRMLTAARELGYREKFPKQYERLQKATLAESRAIMHWCRTHL